MKDHEQHFGLFNNDGSPKEAAVGLHDLTTILADTGATAASFTAGTLAYTITNLPSSGNSLLLQKSNGSFDLAIWAEPEIWNLTTLQEITVAATPVTLSLGQMAGTVEVYDPLSGTAPIASYTDVSQITLGITDHPLIVEIDPLIAPTLSKVAAIQATTGTIAPFATVMLGDPSAQDNATIVLSSTTNGTLSDLGSGTYSPITGVYTISGAPAMVAAALQQITFTPAAASATTLDLTISSTAGTSSIVTSVTDAAPPAKPILSSVPATQAASTIVTPFANLEITDGSATEGASVALSTTSQGTLSNFGIGTYSAATGTYSVNGTPAQVAAALQHLIFTPSAGAAMAYTTTLHLSISNQAGTSGDVTSVTGLAPLPKPALSGLPATRIASATIAPFATLQVVNLTATLGASVVLSSTSQGTLGNFGIGTYAAATGVYSVNGTSAQVAAALQDLTFTPAAASQVVSTTSLILSVSSSAGTSSSTTSVARINQTGLPVPTAESPSVAPWTGAANVVPTPVIGEYNEAVVAAPASGAQILAPAGFQAVLLGGKNAVQLTDASQGNVVLVANQGNDTLQASKAGDMLIGGSGTDKYNVSGGDTVVAGSGTTSITSSGGNTLQLGTGNANVNSTGGDTIQGGSGAATISAGTGDTVFAGSGTLNFIGGTGTTTVTDASGSILLTAPSQVNVSDLTGTISTNGGMFREVALIGGGNRTVECGNGTETVNASGSTGANMFLAGGGNDQILGGTGNTVIVAGGGNDTFSGAGHTSFEFINGDAGGNDVINGFNPAIDSIVMQGYAASAIAAAVQTAQTIGGSSRLQLTDGTHLTFTGVTGVSSAWFTQSLH
jgi:Ca2+-binding RTX toxin-like protein